MLAAPGPAAHAAEPEDPIQIVLDAMTPVVATPDDTLEISGRVINRSSRPITTVRVQLRRSTTPLTNPNEITAVLEEPLSPPNGGLDGLPLYTTTQLVTDTLAPGARHPFSLSVPFATMGLDAPGTYVLGIEATGRDVSTDTTEVRKADVRTFLPWFPTRDSVAPLQLVWLWPLADWPARTASGELLNNRTPSELSPGGRLDRLLDLGSRFRSTVSWILDPALLQTAQGMANGYQVLAEGTPTIGEADDAAGAWLTHLRQSTSDGSVRSIPYADVDAAAVVRAGMSNDVVRAVTQGPAIAAAVLKGPAPGGIYWAPFGRLDRETANVLASAGADAIILSSASMPPSDSAQGIEGLATAALPTSVGTVRAVLTDTTLTRMLSLPQRTPNDVVLARQQFLAQTALLATSIPADQSSRTVVVAPDNLQWDPTASLVAPLLRAMRTAPWLAPQTLEGLLREPIPSATRQRGGYGTKARAAELPADYMARIAKTATKLSTFTAILDDPTGVSEPYSEALLRAQSAAWRTSPEVGSSLVSHTSTDLSVQMGQVRVLSTGTITFSGDTGRVPVTIENNLDRAVTVGLTLVGQPALRLTATPLTDIHIEPGKMASVDINARVVGGDPLTVEVQLLTPDMAPYGKPATIQVRSTAYSRAAAYVVAAAFLAIAVFVVVGVTRRIHKARSTRTPGDLGT